MVGAVIGGILLYLINATPGWQAVPFLTADTSQVLGLVNASLIAGLVANVTFVVYDASWWKSFGELVSTSISLASLVRILQVFPFDFGETAFDWPVLARVVLVVAVVGSAIGLVVHLVSFIRHAIALGP
jgi:hypothetical protein